MTVVRFTKTQFKQQANTTVRAFFLHLKKEGLVFSDFEKRSIMTNSFSDLSTHISYHRVNQNTIDAYKLCGFLSYYAGNTVWAKNRDNLNSRDVSILCKTCIERMSTTLEIETSKSCLLYTSPSPRDRG